MLGRMISGSQVLLAQDALSGGANYIVTNDAEWDAVFAKSARSLKNRIIDIAAPASAFTQRSITDKDIAAAGGRLTIRSANPACGLPSIILNGTVRGIDFAGLNFQMTGWPKAYGSCFVFNNGTFGDLRFLNGTSFRHGYGASLSDFDTAAQLPEYDRVSNVRTATTTSAAHALVWKDPSMTDGWIEFFNRGANAVHVAVGGPGVTATTASTACPAGGNIRITGLNPVTATHFAVLAVAGTSEVNARTEIGLAAYLAAPFGASGLAVVEDIEIRNCLFRDLASGVKGINPLSAVIMDNDFDRIYQDVISLSARSGGFLYILRNLECLSFSRSGIAENLNGDARDPHGDNFQMFGGGTFTIGPVYYAGNRIRVGAKRIGVSNQGIFVSDNDIIPSYSHLFVVSSMQVGGAPRAVSIGEAGYPVRDLMIYGATIVDWRDAASTFPTLTIFTDQDGSTYAGSVIVPARAYPSGGLPSEDGFLRLQDAASPAAVFPNLATLPAATTRAEIEAAITTAAAGAGLGAVATANAIDWTTTDHTAVIRWENVPSGADWRNLTNQPSNTLIELPRRKILNRRPGQTVSVGAGTEWRSFAADGTTPIRAWSNSPGTIEPDQFIEIRHTSGAGGTSVTASVTINGFAQNVDILAANAPPTSLVMPSPSAFFGATANPPAGLTRVTFRGKFFWPAGTLANNQKMFAQLSLGCDLETFGNGFRVSVEDGTQAAMFNSAPTRHLGSWVAGAWLDIVFDVDQVARVVRLTVNGVTETYPFDNPGNGVFNTVRRFSFLAVQSGTNPLAATVRAAELSIDYNGVRHKTIGNTASAANADTWKLGTGNFTN